MQTMCFVADEPQEPQAQEWLQHATQLAYDFSREVHGNDPSSHASDVVAIRLAATVLWRTTNGRPCWSALDPDAVRDHIVGLGLPLAYVESALFTLYALYCYLAKHGLLPPEFAVMAQDRIAPHVRDLVRRIADDHPDLADHPVFATPGPVFGWSPPPAAPAPLN